MKKTKPDKAVLFIRVGRFELTRYAPPNFYEWSFKSQMYYIFKRWPRASGDVCDGVPFTMGGRSIVLKKPRKFLNKLRKPVSLTKQ